jgi:hypothetical protein
VAFNDTSEDQHDNVIAAARMAASWARKRRAVWTDVPVAVVTTAPESRSARAEVVPPTAPESRPPRAEIARPTTPESRPPRAEISPPFTPTAVASPPLLSPPPAAIPESGPSAVAQAVARVRALGAPAAQWLLPHARAAVLLAAVVTGGLYWWNEASTRPAPAAVVAPAPVRPQVLKRKSAAGGLRVTSTPAAAQVFVDGKARGVTPLTLTDLSVGRHAVELKSAAGTVERTVTIAADKTEEMDESIFSGWLAVYSPFDLVATEGGRALMMDDRHQIMLSPGRHVLRFVNRALAYEAVRQVDLKPGEVTTLTVAPPPSTITVTATEAAEVWLDGARVGETPLNAFSVPLGSHEIVVKRAAGGDRRITATVTVNPYTLHVDFSKPAG